MTALVAALLLGLGLPRCGDSFHLRWEAVRAGLPPLRVEAIARAETECNLDPRVLGRACRRTPRACDRGRFQIRPATAHLRCPGLDTRTYRGNVACALWVLSEDRERYGPTDAIVRFNGDGPRALAYLRKVLKIEEAL